MVRLASALPDRPVLLASELAVQKEEPPLGLVRHPGRQAYDRWSRPVVPAPGDAPGCPVGGCGRTWVVAAAAVRPVATAAPRPAGAPGWFPAAGRCCCAGGVTGAGARCTGGAAGFTSGCSAFLPSPRRAKRDGLGADGGGGSHTGTALGAGRATGVPGVCGDGVGGCA